LICPIFECEPANKIGLISKSTNEMPQDLNIKFISVAVNALKLKAVKNVVKVYVQD